MIILCVRTDKPEAELYLFDDQTEINKIIWAAHRLLSITIHKKIDEILKLGKLQTKELEGIVIYKGPGSFTGLRIGFSVANSMASIFKVPVVASGGKNWILEGISRLQSDENDRIALPEYGSPANTSLPKK